MVAFSRIIGVSFWQRVCNAGNILDSISHGWADGDNWRSDGSSHVAAPYPQAVIYYRVWWKVAYNMGMSFTITRITLVVRILTKS